MNKKEYMKPAMRVVLLTQRCCILNGSRVDSIGGNVFNQQSISGGNGDARSREWSGWDDEEE